MDQFNIIDMDNYLNLNSIKCVSPNLVSKDLNDIGTSPLSDSNSLDPSEWDDEMFATMITNDIYRNDLMFESQFEF